MGEIIEGFGKEKGYSGKERERRREMCGADPLARFGFVLAFEECIYLHSIMIGWFFPVESGIKKKPETI